MFTTTERYLRLAEAMSVSYRDVGETVRRMMNREGIGRQTAIKALEHSYGLAG